LTERGEERRVRDDGRRQIRLVRVALPRVRRHREILEPRRRRVAERAQRRQRR
jgi:hypothetical protein